MRDIYVYENIPSYHIHIETHLSYSNFENIPVCILLILQQIVHIDFLRLPIFTPLILKLECALSTGKISIHLI